MSTTCPIRTRVASFLLALSVVSPSCAAVPPWEYLQTLSRGEQGAGLGEAISASGEWLAIGSPFSDVFSGLPLPTLRDDAGVVLMYRRQADGSYALHGTSPLRSQAGPETGARYGYSVSLSGTRLLVGSPLHGDNGEGRIEFWHYDAGTDEWQFEVGYDGTHGTGGFGFAVALSGDRAAAGEPGFDPGGMLVNTGRVHSLVRNAADTFYIPVQAVMPIAPVSNGSFGAALAIADFQPLLQPPDRLVVGEPNAGVGASGLAWIYRIDAGDFSFDQLVAPPAGFDGADFGTALDISGAYVAVGGRDASLVSVSRRNANGSWSLLAPLAAPMSSSSALRFGEALDFHGARLLVGHPQDGDAASTGRAHLFVLAADGDGFDYGTRVFQPPAATGVWSDFGAAVALDGLSGTVAAPIDAVDGNLGAGRIAVYFTGRLLRDGFELVQ
jgi:hypothetical protein